MLKGRSKTKEGKLSATRKIKGFSVRHRQALMINLIGAPSSGATAPRGPPRGAHHDAPKWSATNTVAQAISPPHSNRSTELAQKLMPMTFLTQAIGKPILLALVLLAIWIPTGSAELIVDKGQLVIVDASGITTKTIEFSSKTPSSSAPQFELDDESTLKATFEILEKSSDAKAASLFSPHQVTFLATGVDTKLHWATAVKTRSKGKAKWELGLSRAPTDLLSLSRTGEVRLELIIGDVSAVHAPVRLNLATFKIPKNLLLEYPYWDTKDGKPPPTLELEKHYVQPELAWTFQPPRKKDNPVFSLAFVAIVISPWIFLLTAWSTISQHTIGGFKLFGAPKLSTTLFILTVVSQEALILTYWAKLRLYQYLPLAFLMSFPLILCGRTALTELRVRRKVSPISAAHLNPNHAFAADGKGKKE
ncbi:hypothetical protein PCANC_19725 [Puccinia coronata f. sp. avenae]|uniref:Ribophorin II C-terminal domain-containing protein n=1 Tax=Puccinia coronata f. sp. avenae TaxID=200324 RepID=A0A2N5TRN1_9BASI|nr:hypothetical protein PCANC_19725 [Puccinia coronata f. sp. avenae]